jgi:tetratricopeptide (TPR) repeat protein
VTARMAFLCAMVVLHSVTCGRDREGHVSEGGVVDTERRASVTAFWSAYRAGLAHARNGRTKAAADSLAAALTIDPSHEGALYTLGNVSFERGLYTEAETAWRKLVKIHPHNVRGFAQLGALHACGQDSTPFNLELAERYFQMMFALNKESSEATMRLGEVYALQGEIDKALDRFDRTISFDPKNREAFILRGLMLWLGGDRSGARTAYVAGLVSQETTKDRPFASEEGDTKTGAALLFDQGARHRNFFSPLLENARRGERAEVFYKGAAQHLINLQNRRIGHGQGPE